MKKIGRWLCALFLLVFLAKVHYFFTDGFRPYKVRIDYPFQKSWDTKAFLTPELRGILCQEFTYLGKGRQAYVFESEDKNYVLKFVRFSKYQVSLWNRWFSLGKNPLDFLLPDRSYEIGKSPSFWQQDLYDKRGRFLRAMGSYALAFFSLQEETGLLFAHLNATKGEMPTIRIRDGWGRLFRIPLDATSFLLQKKVLPLDSFLLSLKDKGDSEEVHKVLSAFLKMAFHRMKKGFMNRDFINCMRNCGYFQEKAIEIDVGSFYREEKLKDPKIFQKELQNFATPMRTFLQQKFPEELSFFDEELAHKLESGNFR